MQQTIERRISMIDRPLKLYDRSLFGRNEEITQFDAVCLKLNTESTKV